ncbi:MAG: DUF5055 domain-containing protein [Bacilli bacterium]
MRKLKLKINDKDYTLEFNRDSIKWLEANGFSIEDFDKKPLTYYDLLWYGLFLANHGDVNPSLAMKLMETYGKEHKVAQVIRFAIDEYNAFMFALADINSEKSDEELEIIEA